MASNKQYCLQALDLADQMSGRCAPNPAVGCVVVKDDKVIATGYHRGPYTEHAERMALNTLSAAQACDATVYITLEPCCHQGRTPPCTDVLIEKKIAAVIYAHDDPNPAVRGRSAKLLAQAGIVCQQLSVAEIDAFYQPYDYWWQHNKPWVSAKLAISSDNKTALAGGRPAKITGAQTNKLTHQLRKRADVILTTINTLQADDPKLNVRLDRETIAKPVYVLDKNLCFADGCQLMQSAAHIILCYHDDLQTAARAKLLSKHDNINCLALPLNECSHLDGQVLLTKLGEQGIHHVWIEAGARLFSAYVQAGMVQRGYLYVATKKLGNDAWPGIPGKFDIRQAASGYSLLAYQTDDAVLSIEYLR